MQAARRDVARPGGMSALARWIAILTPAVLVAFFEYVRHRYLLSLVPMDVGNWLTAGLAFAASAVVVGSLYSVLERLRDEAEERRRRLALLEERDRIASALHDGICQSLFFANVRLGKAEEALRRGAWEEARAALDEGRFAIRSAHDDVRQTVFNLRMARPLEAGLGEALREHLEEFGRQTGLATEAAVGEGCDLLPPEAASQVVQIVREALWNVRKHAEAGRVTLSCARRGEAVVVEVGDDGRGFDVGAARRNGRTFGLAIMEDRARAAGGSLRVESRPGGGTRVTVTVPVGRPSEGARGCEDGDGGRKPRAGAGAGGGRSSPLAAGHSQHPG